MLLFLNRSPHSSSRCQDGEFSMEIPSRHEPFEPPTMAKRATSYPSLPPSSSLCPSLHLILSIHPHCTVGMQTTEIRRNTSSCHTLPSFSAVCSRSLFEINPPAPRQSCCLHHGGPAELLPSGSCSTDQAQEGRGSNSDPRAAFPWFGPGSEGQGCAGDTAQPRLAPLALGAAAAAASPQGRLESPE